MTDPLSIGVPGPAAQVGPGPLPSGHWPADVELSEHDSTHGSVRAASVRGVLHRAYGGSPRQDAYAVSVASDDETLVAVVCDGVGSHAASHVAASLVSGAVLGTWLAEPDWVHAIRQANLGLRVRAGQAPMATTVVAAAVRFQPEGAHVVAAGVGDSELWLLADDGWTRLLPSTQSSSAMEEPATGRTKALPASDPQIETLDAVVGPGSFFLITDGVGMPLEMSAMVRRTLAEWWATPPDGFDFARQVGFAMETFLDDRTAVGFWPPVDLQGVSPRPDLAPESPATEVHDGEV